MSKPVARKSCPDIDVVKLTTAFDTWVKTNHFRTDMFSFGVYDTIGRTMAASPSGLHQNVSFLLMLLQVAPWGQVNPAILRSCFLRQPNHNHSTLRADLWAGGRAERVTTMLNHVRRLKDSSEKYRQCLAKATPAESKSINALLSASSSDEYESDVERLLGHHVSCDSDGYPTMLASQGSEDGLGYSQPKKPANSDSIFDAALKDAASAAKVLVAEVYKRPASSAIKRPAASLARVGKKCASSASAEQDDNMSVEWGRLYVTKASAQSYIQYNENGCKKLLVGCSKSMADKAGKHHHDVIELLVQRARTNATVEQLKAYRSELLS